MDKKKLTEIDYHRMRLGLSREEFIEKAVDFFLFIQTNVKATRSHLHYTTPFGQTKDIPL
jgi:hypothetical protein